MLMDMRKGPISQKVGHRQKRRGFTLTEIAIVLGIIGLILGAIWVAAAAVYNNLRTSKATTQLLTVAQNVRAMYATSNTVDPLADMTLGASCGAANAAACTYIAAGVFPNDTVNTAQNEALDSWQGTIVVQSQKFTNTSDSFSVVFDNVPQSACIAMVTANSGQGKDPALVGVSIGASGAAPIAAAAATSGATYTAFPVLASQAQTSCVATGNAVAFSFKLKG